MSNINITYSCKEAIDLIKDYIKESNYVCLYTSNLNSFTSSSAMMDNLILNLIIGFSRQEGKEVSIISDFYIDKDSFTDSNLNKTREFKYKGIPVKVFHKKSAIDKFFLNLKNKISPIMDKKRDEYIIKEAQDDSERELLRKIIANEKPLEIAAKSPLSFYDMFDFTVTYYDECRDILRDCLNTLKHDLISDAKSLISSEGLDGAKFERSINECFKELDKNLADLNANSDEFLIKQIVLFILSLADMCGTKGVTAIGLGVYEFAKLAYILYEYKTTRAIYAAALPILSFFTSRFASIINTLNINSNCNILVFKKDKDSKSGFFIDFTHLNLGYQFFTNPNNQNEINYNADEGCIIYGHLDDIRVFDYSKALVAYDIVNKNLGFGCDDTLFDRLKKQMIGLNANLNFICASNFNSIKLANLIANKSNENPASTNDAMNNKDFSNLNKNYIVISNSPFKSSAGLRQEVIIKSLEQEIKDELNRLDKSNLVKQKFSDVKTLSPVKDYSKYSIDINKGGNKSTLVLNLSPFARIDKSYIDNIEQKVHEYENIAYKDDINYINNHLKYDELLRVNLAHISAYTKKPNDMAQIKKNEEAYMKKTAIAFKEIFNRVSSSVLDRKKIEYNEYIINSLSKKLSSSQIHYYNRNTQVNQILKSIPGNYSLIEVLSLVVAYFIITKSFLGDLLKKSSGYDGEYIKISQESIMVLLLNSSVKLGDKSLRLFFYKDTAKKSGFKSSEYLCIEDIVEYIDKANVTNISSIEDLLMQNDIDTNNKEDTLNHTDTNKELEPDLEQQRYIQQLLDEQEKQIQSNLQQDSATLKDVLKMQDHAYDNSRDIDKEVTSFILKSAIEGVFPLAKFASEDGIFKIYEALSSFIFNPNKKELANTLLNELGILNIARQLFIAKDIKNIDKFLKSATNLKTTTKALKKSKKNIIIQAINIVKLRLLIGYYNLNIVLDQLRSFTSMKRMYNFNQKDVKALKNILNGYGKSLSKDVGVSLLSGMIELYKTSYEQLKQSYKEIMHTRYTYKFNEAYALNNVSYKPLSINKAFNKNSTQTYCYYPVMIYQNYISLNLNRLFLGANISSGGLDYNSFIYYDINSKYDKLPKLASKLALNNLSAYLCLDELRGVGNDMDALYFKYARSRYVNSDVDIRELNLDVKEEKEVYDAYRKANDQDRNGLSYAIDSYQKAVQIINKFKKGIFNTGDSNSHSNLARELVEALDIIGNNNIKGIYVGCREEWKTNQNLEEKSMPPRLVGRLATTIVMEDGLYIG